MVNKLKALRAKPQTITVGEIDLDIKSLTFPEISEFGKN